MVFVHLKNIFLSLGVIVSFVFGLLLCCLCRLVFSGCALVLSCRGAVCLKVRAWGMPLAFLYILCSFYIFLIRPKKKEQEFLG